MDVIGNNPTPLYNGGNTCYVNAALQFLGCVPQLYPLSENVIFQRLYDGKPVCTREIQALVSDVFPEFAGRSQQDPHEWILRLLERLSTRGDVLDQPGFQSISEISVVHEACGYHSLHTIASHPHLLFVGQGQSVEQALQQYEMVETVAISCGCGDHIQASRVERIRSPPAGLLVVLDRYSSSVERAAASLQMQWHTTTYTLCASIQYHRHGTNGGHYTTVTRRDGMSFYNCDDGRITCITESQFEAATRLSYLLLYVAHTCC